MSWGELHGIKLGSPIRDMLVAMFGPRPWSQNRDWAGASTKEDFRGVRFMSRVFILFFSFLGFLFNNLDFRIDESDS